MAWNIVDEVMQANNSGLKPTDVHVLLAVAWHADKDTREAWPGTPLLAEETGLSERAIREALMRLRTPDEAGFAWLLATYEGYHQRLLTVSKDLPKRPPRPRAGRRSARSDTADDAAMRQEMPDDGPPLCGTSRLTMRQEMPDDAADAAAPRQQVPHDAAGDATEQVSNRSEKQVTEQVTRTARDEVPPEGTEEDVRTPAKPVTTSTLLLDHFMARLKPTLRDYGLPIPGGMNKSQWHGRIKQIRSSSGIDWPELVELVDLYMKVPSTWNPKVHPAADFVTGNTFARLRNRLHEIRVSTEQQPEPSSDHLPGMQAANRAWLDGIMAAQRAEGSDDQ